jgi:SAM-dependent methyltransferase
MANTGYLLDNREKTAGIRFTALGELFDATTFRILTERGIAPGWRCWEVGAGGATVPRWLSEQVGPTGHVLATDLDPTWATSAASATVDIHRHDLAKDAYPAEPFDLIHARLVLVHVRERQTVLEKLVACLKPGGWLVIEDADPALQSLACPDACGPDQELANRIRHGFRSLLAARGVDLAYGRTLPRVLRAANLTDVAATVHFPLSHPAAARLEAATVAMISEGLITGNLATAEEIALHLDNLSAGRLDVATAPMISCWGRRHRMEI